MFVDTYWLLTALKVDQLKQKQTLLAVMVA